MGITKEHIERIEKQAKVMESFGDAAVDVSSELYEIVQDNYQMELQIEFLLETNDRLRERLDSDECLDPPIDCLGKTIHVDDAVYFDGEIEKVFSLCWNGACWEIGLLGSHELKAPIDCIVVPKSLLSGADGVPIALGDTVYCDDDPEPLKVVSLHGNTGSYCTVGLEDSIGIIMSADAPRLSHKKPEPLEPEPDDSWEKLEEDARKTPCDYACAPLDSDGLTTCDGCRLCKRESCYAEMTLEVLERAKKLAGVEEAKEASDD